jgi:DNA modification methylase
MSLLLNGDCLELMKEIEDDSVDLIFCDLPYGQTSCKWDCKIDLDKFWIEIMRIKKLRTPIFFTTTTKFGVSLITSAPKKCHFRYDIVWVKSAPAGFLSAKKMPMRKHEMVYVFYEKLPFYDLSSHKHKFIKPNIKNEPTNKKEDDLYGVESGNAGRKKGFHQTQYNPPLPVSVVNEGLADGQTLGDKGNECYGKFSYYNNGVKGYEPSLPVSVVKEDLYGMKGQNKGGLYAKGILDNGIKTTTYEPSLPTTMLEIKSTRGKHSTEKPVALMEWILKYYSKEGDVVLDPTMGSGSTGVACKNMNRNFIGIEMDEDIYDSAVKRIEG